MTLTSPEIHADPRTLVTSLGSGTIDPVAYDTAWALLADLAIGEPERARTRAAWLRRTQHPDGSWGSPAWHAHDRFVNTAMAWLALDYLADPADQPRLAAALTTLREASDNLPRDHYELVLSELLIPRLADWIAQRGGTLPGSAYAYEAERRRKLELLASLPLYSPRNQTTHSLEFLTEPDIARLPAALSANGSLGNSPAATAWLLTQLPDLPAPRRYLEGVTGPAGACTTLAPWENFEHQYVLYLLSLAGLSPRAIGGGPILDRLAAAWTSTGLSLDRNFVAPDGDDTALAIYLLTLDGRQPDITPLVNFHRGAFFTTYPEERNPSLLVNFHALEALTVAGRDATDPLVASTIVTMLGSQREDGWWLDKWHISPLFIGSQAAAALIPFARSVPGVGPALTRLADAVLAHQTDAGFRTVPVLTREETASGVLTLALLQRAGLGDYRGPLEHGVAALGHLPADRVPLWVAKPLFYPPHIVDATALAASLLARQVLEGNDPVP